MPRNDRLWHDVHQAHLDRAEVSVWNDDDHQVVMVGEVTEIDDYGFLVESTINSARESFSFADGALVIQR